MYEHLLDLANSESLIVKEEFMPSRIKGLYSENVIWINRKIETNIEKGCILAEEIGHYYTSAGDTTDQRILSNRKQEKKARSWAYEYMLPFEKILNAYHSGIRDKYDLADYLDVNVDFLEQSVSRYKERYGLSVIINNDYIIQLDPLSVVKTC